MKRIVLKSILIQTVVIATTISSFGQLGISDGSKYGHGEDSIRCVRNLSLFREYVKHKDYDIALPFWQIVFHECPKSSKNIFLDGVKIYKSYLNKTHDEVRKEELLDTLLLIYERRIQSFGEKGNVMGRMGVDLLKYGRDKIENIEKAHNYLKESIILRKQKTSNAVLGSYVSSSIILYQNNVLLTNAVIEDYMLTSKILDEKIALKPNDKRLRDLKTANDNNFIKDGPGDCEKLIEYFSSEMENKKEDIDFLQMLTSLLRDRDCTKSDLFFQASKDLHKLAPGSESALNIAILAYTSGDYREAANYYQQALTLETDDDKKADYYYGLASCSTELKNKTKAREYARKAMKLRPDWGEPYILVGKLYANSVNDCNSVSLPKAVYWAAVDQFKIAKRIDSSVEELANKSILTYSKYFPNKEDAFFHNVTEGDSYLIGCWINESVKARFNN